MRRYVYTKQLIIGFETEENPIQIEEPPGPAVPHIMITYIEKMVA